MTRSGILSPRCDLSRFVFLSIFALFVTISSFAAELKVWTPQRGGPRLILPVGDHEEPEEAAARYLERLYDSNALGPAMKSEWLGEVTGTFSDFPDRGAKPVMVLVDNSFEPHKKDLSVFKNQGADAYLVPLGVELALKNEAERARFKTLLAKNVDGMVLLGGHDIDPRLYNSRNTYSEQVNGERDRMELGYASALLRQGNGALFGICRGQQLIGVLFGYKLHQDIFEQLGAAEHVDVNHKISIEGGHLGDAIGDSAKVYSLHHQAVDMDSHPRGRLKATAYSAISGDATIVEALESADGRVFAVQYHPELMNTATGRATIEKMVSLAKEARGPNCFRRMAGLAH